MFSMLLFAHVFDTAICACFDTAICLCLNPTICATLNTSICSYVDKTTNLVIIMVINVIPGIVDLTVYLEKKCREVFCIIEDERLEHAPCACDA